MGALARKDEPEAFQDGIAAVSIDGRVVLFDMNVWKLDGRTDAVVSRFDGSIGIEKPYPLKGNVFSGPRGAVYGCGPLGNDRYEKLLGCLVYGKVIDA